MRGLAVVGLAALLCGCASARVALLPPEPGSAPGAVAVFDPKTEAELGVLDQPNTQTVIGGDRKVRATPVSGTEYADLAAQLPAPPATYALYFVEGSTDLVPKSEPELTRMLDEVAKRPGAEVQVTGHTDALGSIEDNDALSRRRAGEIKEVLVARGLDPTIARAVGRGERELLVQTEDGVAEPRNRRVVVTVR